MELFKAEIQKFKCPSICDESEESKRKETQEEKNAKSKGTF